LTTRIVFLHGIGGQAKGFDEHVALLNAKGFSALAWDQPGYGGKALIEPYTFASIAKQLIGELAADSATQATVLVGHSMGGMLAQTVAIANSIAKLAKLTNQPNKGNQLNLVGLVLAQSSPAFGNSDGEFQKKFIADRVAPLDAGKTMADVAQKLVPAMVAPQADPMKVQAALALMSGVPEATYRAALNALVAFDARPSLDLITLPVLCLAAEFDKTAPAAVLEKLAAKLSHGHYQCLTGVGHLAPMENPKLFCQSVENFIRGMP
jgi:3-oxoadipate enol-lactonase